LASPNTYFPPENNGSLPSLHCKNHHAHGNILPGNRGGGKAVKMAQFLLAISWEEAQVFFLHDCPSFFLEV